MPKTKVALVKKPRNVVLTALGVLVILNLIIFDVAAIIDSASNRECSGNVARIQLRGELVAYIPPENLDQDGYVVADQTSSEDIVRSLRDADNNDDVRGVILEIDSAGGSAVAAEEVEKAVQASGKPVVALVREYGDSAAYYSATGASRIFASKNSDVGSIGVTMSYLDYSQKNSKEGVQYQQISSGKFKDTGDPDKPLTDEERKYLERDMAIMNENFIKTVATNRKMDIERVRAMADGSSMLGEKALEKGLIDEIGGLPEVKKYLESKLKIHPKICEF